MSHKKGWEIMRTPLILSVLVMIVSLFYTHYHFKDVKTATQFLDETINAPFLIISVALSLIVYLLVAYAGYLAVRVHKKTTKEAFRYGLVMGLVLYAISAIYTIYSYTSLDYYRLVIGQVDKPLAFIIVNIIIGLIISVLIYGLICALGGWIGARKRRAIRKAPPVPKKVAKRRPAKKKKVNKKVTKKKTAKK